MFCLLQLFLQHFSPPTTTMSAHTCTHTQLGAPAHWEASPSPKNQVSPYEAEKLPGSHWRA